MSIRSLGNLQAVVPPSAYVDPTAVVIGDVRLGEDVSVWPTAVLRGDIHSIHVGARSNVQDGSVLHVTHQSEFNPDGFPLHVGEGVTIGHRVILHGCTIGDHCLIGMGCTVMDGAVLGAGVLLGAGSLVPPNKELEGGYLWLGNPARRQRPLTEAEKAYFEYSASHYVRLKNRYQAL